MKYLQFSLAYVIFRAAFSTQMTSRAVPVRWLGSSRDGHSIATRPRTIVIQAVCAPFRLAREDIALTWRVAVWLAAGPTHLRDRLFHRPPEFLRRAD
jgi:hypothetical protein